ncbi:transposase [Bacteroidales bacterium 6E]|nr:transposase [Bacteroidales bacterium 6E]GAP68286.1 transposase [Bacteroidales bacterium 6E]
MNRGKYVFSQLVEFLPKRAFDCIVMNYQGDKYIKSFSCWNQLLIMMYGQLSGCESLRELICIVTAHSPKSYHMGFGKSVITRSNLSKANANRDSKIFEEFAYKMISIAQGKRITRDFVLDGRFYAFDSTTIDLCMNLFWWANFRQTKAGIKVHTLYDVVTQIPAFIHITEARVHDMNAMDEIPYEPNAWYIFDRGYFDLSRLFTINLIGSNFVIRERGQLQYEVIDGEDLLECSDNIVKDQTIRLTGPQTRIKYPSLLRRVVYYSTEHKRTFTYLTNRLEISAKNIAMLYKNRWQVELFFKWIKQHLHIKSFWGVSENAVRVQIYTAIATYCLVAIVEHDLRLNRSTFDVLRILSMSLFDKTPIRELFERAETTDDLAEIRHAQLSFNF